jgi:membrane protease YdiL (CAAX protease family)
MEKPSSLSPQSFFKTACYFEASLVLFAIFLGWVANINPFENIHFSERAVLFGVAGTLPLLLLFLTMEHLPFVSVQKIRLILIETLGSSLHKCSWADLFTLAAIAGISEEILFRGVIQPWIEGSWGLSTGLIVSNILLGLVHAVTPLYAVLATIVGMFLGLSLDYGGERNLLTPIIIHGLYDFLAFLAIMRSYRAIFPENH